MIQAALVAILFAVSAHSQPDWDEPAGRRFNVSSDEEINDLQDTLLPGDYMVLQPGGDWYSPDIRLTADGESGEGMKVYLMVEEPGTVILTGNVLIRLSGSYQEMRGIWLNGTTDDKFEERPIIFERGSSNNRMTNCAITDFNRAQGDELDTQKWIDLWGSYHTLDWNDFIDKTTFGEMIQMRGIRDDPEQYSWGHYVGHNYFGPRPPTAIGDRGEALQIGLSFTDYFEFNVTVEFNLFEEFDGEIECISVKSANNIVRYNTFRNSACTVTLRHGNRTTVEENYFFCEGKFHCGGVRMHGYEHLIKNNYIQDEFYSNGAIAGMSIYQGISDDPLRDINYNSTIVDNVMVNCSRCIAMGWASSTGGDQVPTGMKFIRNVMTAKSNEDYVYLEVTQDSTSWEDNVGWNGIIDNEEDVQPGLERVDPGLEFNVEFGMFVPTNVDWDFEMTYKPLQRADVGTNWLDYKRK